MQNWINMADIIEDSVVDGPGVRTVIFVQGCDHHCPGCHNAAIQGVGGYYVEPRHLAEQVTRGSRPVHLTLSGGEPMLQAEALLELLTTVRRLADGRTVDVWCYTGFTWEEVQADDARRALAEACDVIMDGRFLLEQTEGAGPFRGSRNQRAIDVARTQAVGHVVEWEA